MMLMFSDSSCRCHGSEEIVLEYPGSIKAEKHCRTSAKCIDVEAHFVPGVFVFGGVSRDIAGFI